MPGVGGRVGSYSGPASAYPPGPPGLDQSHCSSGMVGFFANNTPGGGTWPRGPSTSSSSPLPQSQQAALKSHGVIFRPCQSLKLESNARSCHAGGLNSDHNASYWGPSPQVRRVYSLCVCSDPMTRLTIRQQAIEAQPQPLRPSAPVPSGMKSEVVTVRDLIQMGILFLLHTKHQQVVSCLPSFKCRYPRPW